MQLHDLPKFSHTTPLLRSLHWLPVAARIRFKTLMLAYKAKNGPAPSYLKALITPRTAPRSLRSTSTARLVPPSLRVKVCAASVEDCCLAVGNVVGHENIVSASRMNSAIVVFLNDVEKVRKLTQNGIVVNNETILVSPLSSPAKKVMLSNVPPFIPDEAIGKELSRYGRMVSPIKKIPLGCKSPLVKHLVSFRRMVFMVFKEGVSELNVVFKFTVDCFDYNIFVSSDTDNKCFKCGQTGHLARACPERQSDPGVSERPGRDAKGPGAAAAPDLTESEPQAQPAAQKPRSPLELRQPRKSHARPNRLWQSHARLDRTGQSRGLRRKAQWDLEQCWS
ncbi:hypothetical protein QTP86_029688 [Hemibagrus guttatus]|nr:hypothetical protein QTP86_029688 [Hemibagrus guttatus]